MADLANAIFIASKAFRKKYDKGGKPYVLHCLHVMNNVRHLGEVAMICGVLHDLIEDCSEDGFTFDYLRKEGFSQEVITIIELLTHREETLYMDYIKALSVHPIAKEIKKRDLEHNSKITRLKGLRKKDIDRMEKYLIAYTYLS
jgi:(p)ppGpp synthase/HD superfamily hydrolase